jgi:hypothetical protein
MVIEESMGLSTYELFGVVLIGVGIASFSSGVGVGRGSIFRAGAESVGSFGSYFYGWLEKSIKNGQFKISGAGQ